MLFIPHAASSVGWWREQKLNNERLGPEGMTENKMILISLGRVPRPERVDDLSNQIYLMRKDEKEKI